MKTIIAGLLLIGSISGNASESLLCRTMYFNPGYVNADGLVDYSVRSIVKVVGKTDDSGECPESVIHVEKDKTVRILSSYGQGSDLKSCVYNFEDEVSEKYTGMSGRNLYAIQCWPESEGSKLINNSLSEYKDVDLSNPYVRSPFSNIMTDEYANEISK